MNGIGMIKLTNAAGWGEKECMQLVGFIIN
jgi:hypothetical protein